MPPSRFEAMQSPQFRRLLVGGVFTFLAMQATNIARGWLAVEIGGSSTAVGGVFIGFGVASVVAIPSGGVLADRFAKRTVLVIAGAIQTLTSLLLCLALYTDSIAYWMLVATSVAQGAIVSILAPARLAYIAEIVDRPRITNAIFLSQTSVQFTRVFGPAVAGFLIDVPPIGATGVYLLGAVLSLGGVVTTFGLPEGKPLNAPSRSPFGDLADGLRFVRGHRQLRHLLVLSFLVVLVGFPYIAFLPVLAENIFDVGSSGLGWLYAVGAVGAVAAALSLARTAAADLERFQTTAAIAFGVSLVLFGLSPVFGLALATAALVGASSASFQALNNSLILELAPVEYHGRVQSLLMLSFSGFALAALPLGILADAIGLQATLAATGVVVVATTVLSLMIRRRHPDVSGATL